MSDTNPLYSGMLWLRRADDKIEVAVGEAIRYAEEKYGRPVHLVMRPVNEAYPAVWRDADTRRDVPVRGDRRVLPHHLYLVTGIAHGEAQVEE